MAKRRNNGNREKIAQDMPISEWLEIIQKAIEKDKKKKEKK